MKSTLITFLHSHRNTFSEDELIIKNTDHHTRRHTHQSPGQEAPINSKPRAKTYGSYDAMSKPTARLLNQGVGEREEGRWGGSAREAGAEDAVCVSLDSHHEESGGEESRVVTPEVAGHCISREGGVLPSE